MLRPTAWAACGPPRRWPLVGGETASWRDGSGRRVRLTPGSVDILRRVRGTCVVLARLTATTTRLTTRGQSRAFCQRCQHDPRPPRASPTPVGDAVPAQGARRPVPGALTPDRGSARKARPLARRLNRGRGRELAPPGSMRGRQIEANAPDRTAQVALPFIPDPDQARSPSRRSTETQEFLGKV